MTDTTTTPPAAPPTIACPTAHGPAIAQEREWVDPSDAVAPVDPATEVPAVTPPTEA